MESARTVYRPWPFVLVLLSFTAIGCGEVEFKSGLVSGKVTLKGEPFSDAGLVFFDPSTGRAASFSLDSSGQFSTEKPVPIGSYKVTLGAKIPTEDEIAAGIIPSPAVNDKIHPTLLDPSRTSLVALVKEGQNDYTFEITVETRQFMRGGPVAPPPVP